MVFFFQFLKRLPLAWQQFQKQTKFQVQISQNSENAKEIIEYLSSLKCDTADVDSSFYYRAGANNEAANEINKDLQGFFHNKPFEKVSNKNYQVIFYAGLNKNITLRVPFYFIPGKIMHFCRSKVPCFEPYTPQQRRQVFVLNYTNDDNFMVRLDLADKGSQMFAIMTKTKLNLDQVFDIVRKSDDQADPMTNNDVFKIPQINICAQHVISDVNNIKIKFTKESGKSYEVGQLIQNVCLTMEGKQQDDNIDALTLTVPQGENPKLKERRMCLKDPFWIVLRYKGCNPYFAAFVNKQIDAPTLLK